MSHIEDIERCLKIFKKNKCKFILMHCVSAYPCELKNINLRSTYKWLTLTPNYINSDGFFICLLKKYA